MRHKHMPARRRSKERLENVVAERVYRNAQKTPETHPKPYARRISKKAKRWYAPNIERQSNFREASER